MVNYSARTDELITLNENISIINKLKNQEITNIYGIYKQLIKSNSIQNLAKEDLSKKKIHNLVAEGQVVNRINQNNDCFHVNKDVVDAFAENILEETLIKFHDRSFESTIINHRDSQNLSNLLSKTLKHLQYLMLLSQLIRQLFHK